MAAILALVVIASGTLVSACSPRTVTIECNSPFCKRMLLLLLSAVSVWTKEAPSMKKDFLRDASEQSNRKKAACSCRSWQLHAECMLPRAWERRLSLLSCLFFRTLSNVGAAVTGRNGGYEQKFCSPCLSSFSFFSNATGGSQHGIKKIGKKGSSCSPLSSSFHLPPSFSPSFGMIKLSLLSQKKDQKYQQVGNGGCGWEV